MYCPAESCNSALSGSSCSLPEAATNSATEYFFQRGEVWDGYIRNKTGRAANLDAVKDMARFRYMAVTQTGRTVRGIIESGNRASALDALREQVLTPLELKSADGPTDTNGQQQRIFSMISLGRARWWQAFLGAPPKAAVVAVTRQLATLLRAGLPLDVALGAICAQQEGGRLDRIMSAVREAILEGSSFADSLSRFPEAFSPTFVTMVQAAEASGTLEPVMERLADTLEQQNAMRRKIRSAMAYPTLMLVVGTGIVIFLLMVVVPQVTQVFLDFKQALPLSTRILITLGDTVSAYWRLLLGAVTLTIFGCWRFFKTGRGRRLLHGFLLRLPLVRSLYQPLLVGQVMRTFGMLLKNGVTLVQALYIVRSVTNNVLMVRAMEDMHAKVQEGRELSELMDDTLLFVPLVRQMVAAGEKSGRLAEMLLWVANDCDNQVAGRLEVLTALVEPVMILVLGSIVGFVVLAVVLPIFQMSTLLG